MVAAAVGRLSEHSLAHGAVGNPGAPKIASNSGVFQMRGARAGAPISVPSERFRLAAEFSAFLALAVITAWSAVLVKEQRSAATAMVAVETAPEFAPAIEPMEREQNAEPAMRVVELATSDEPITRWFDARPVRPVRTIWMKVTAYSPDARSCGAFADGKTSTLHSVYTNAMRLVAADPKVLPEGSIISVPGYADGEVVPVLDRGGAIKGARLDVLMPTHSIARKWGVREIPVTVYEYADGLPATNPRKAR